ncbi:class III lanthionine synthetase LanKC [Nonomuraea typhae]|uniref:class III lanthionine synthetase LanKC n=1 Tax=Nonomuraea typhae TaxID=2603600 RepID=UPI0012F72742|nr:class III lanthionine synthetase LanKC [Nonomuraea typhae]
MDKRYEVYCLVDRTFYDSPLQGMGAADYPRPEAPGWTVFEQDDWVVYRPDGCVLPDQGWKVHASACLANAAEILEILTGYCISRKIPFKFLRGRDLLHLRNAKYADRGASGKLAALYPADETQLQAILAELGGLLAGRAGPYILSDLRIGGGPLYVRYGGITERYCVTEHGRVEPAIADLEGNLVPDRRGPVFSTPPWIRLPPFLEPHLAARAAASLDGLPYRIDKVLRFSNGGGVYLGTDRRSGHRVVLKEARAHAGLDAGGDDAVTRLRREREVLRRLDGLAVAPRLLDEFTVDEHSFLVMEHIDGDLLTRAFAERYPLGGQGRGDRDEYAAWALRVCAAVEAAVAAVHERGLVFRDVHPGNVIVRPDGRVALIDHELARPADEAGRTGTAAPEGLTGVDVDRYGLACLRLAMFLPITELCQIDRVKAVELAEVIRDHFTLPADFLDEAVLTITGDRRARRVPGAHIPAWNSVTLADPERWQRLRRSMTMGILASATPERDDRLFPGDVEQFITGGLNLAHGAAGVLYALDVTGAGRFPEHEEWLLTRAMKPREGSRLGFYDGLHGLAHTLAHFGRPAEALDLAERISRERWQSLGLDLHGGLSGIGLNLMYLAETTGQRDLHTQALKVIDLVASRLGEHPPSPGLMYGAAGAALLFLRGYDRTGETSLLHLAERALRNDLARYHIPHDVGRDPGFALDKGSVGLAWVLAEYLARRPGDALTASWQALDLAARSPFSIQSGLFTGRAGILAYLCRNRWSEEDPAAESHLRALGWHALRYQAHLAFPGERLLRLSMDLATGTAGVLLAVGAALHEEAISLPFLGPARLHSPRPMEVQG